ncbi:ADP-ribosylglycohydrolase family protein [Paenibacillus psychroresistens]|uniref:ADP-ribosylglycohydrolase family protein n=1 Tax=Paenibacillus psychroresistens TaxID=1778678 RepID=A0A6B8RF39_9BACL|nr:ADP-ribosylglycohydrolase family protein [Paenibacillus psychroresistens]QGQ94133.1 ADP-ribosylglycohydrolase family protein [Paenibacillus psychroresistens]
MKKQISYELYLDKVYGAWLGKSIAGTIGAPYEGRKELFDYDYDPKAIAEMLPNDDLDLQVIWLHVLETKGIYFTSNDLADAFYHLYPYSPGEYAYFKKNYERGLNPPLSGSFNNRYYINGMGCPIRSEIWGCISPGNPQLAAEYAAKDGVLDHAGDSVYAEQYLAALEAMAFFEDDLDKLMLDALVYLPEGTKIRRLADDTMKWSKTTPDWRKVREMIIRDYGHPDCTNLYQNIGFTFLSLIYGEKEFLKTSMLALNCGFDTDCSCATAGAILGIIYGATDLIERYNFYDTSYKLDALLTRKSNKLFDLAEDTCRAGVTAARRVNTDIEITGVPDSLGEVPSVEPTPRLNILIDYLGIPVIGLNETKTLSIQLTNETNGDIFEKVHVLLPEGWTTDWQEESIFLRKYESISKNISISIPTDLSILSEKNTITVECGCYQEKFGLNGAQIWRVFGPYWDNYLELPPTELGEWYYPHIKAETEDLTTDLVRQFHLNTKADLNKAYLQEPEFTEDALHNVVNISEDLFSVSDMIGFQGPCVVYAERLIYSKEDQEVSLIIGHSDAYKLWLNGELLSEADQVDWWTAENRHLTHLQLKKGQNRLLLKCHRHGKDAQYSLIFTQLGKSFPKHITDLGSYSQF